VWKDEPMSLDNMFRSRRIRIVIALALIAVSFYALSPYLVYRGAPSAFVNASLTRVTAPISGNESAKGSAESTIQSPWTKTGLSPTPPMPASSPPHERTAEGGPPS
jgi:hypothetical protein